MALQFDSEDNGNCRVYYRDGKRFYCYQNEGSWGRVDWKYYTCTRDGEPSYEVAIPAYVPMPPGETAIGRDLILYIATCRVDGCGKHAG